jgi:hypothetical protein
MDGLDTATQSSNDRPKLEGRGAGNRPARGVLGSTPSQVADSAGQPESRPPAALQSAMSAVLGKTRVSPPGAPEGEQQPERKPARRKKPAAQEQRPASRRPAPPQRDESDAPDGEEDEAPDGPEDEQQEEQRPRGTRKGADFARAADDAEGEDAEDAGTDAGDDGPEEGGTDAALQGFAQRFGIKSLAQARQARNNLVDDFAATIGAQGAQIGGTGQQQASPAAFPAQGTQPHAAQPQASGQPPNTPPAHSQQAGPGQRKQLTKETVDGLIETFGAEFKPVAEFLVQLQDDAESLRRDNEAFRTRDQQRIQQEAAHTIDRFFASKVKAGFRERYGSQRDGLNNGHFAARTQLIQNAAAFQAAKAQQGHFVADEDALEAAFQFAHKDDLQQQARDQGRREVGTQLQRRHRSLDLVGGRGTGTPKGDATGNQLASTIKSFINPSRNRR